MNRVATAAMQPEDLRELRDDLRRERQRMENLVATLVRSLSRLGEGPDPVEAAALRLHSFYTGIERALLLVSRTLNGGTPRQGDSWHRRLLERMAMATDHRPAVLRESTQMSLQEYLRFRHLVRNLYADELSPEPITALIKALPEVWSRLEADLRAFEDWASALAERASAG
ncbi:hypothetical protein [Synechococcus sp. RedBA-s]|uniref:ribonuclease toxin HepT-like protein n=1 Tax=Synechococcus sp. RedBA-s TaxID=2823741 RepID=UPI0020CE50B8|nr:hypothetical protein [Synechococcus sp. RedBA-s]